MNALDLFDLSAFQALVALREALQHHPLEGLAVRGEDDTIRVNIQRQLDKQGRRWREQRQGRLWVIDVEALATQPTGVQRPPVLVLRSAFAPGDRALGRRLLVDTLRALDRGVPWLCLAHEALDLLEDPSAMETLEGLREEGIPVFISTASRQYLGLSAPFPDLADEAWQGALGRGELTVL